MKYQVNEENGIANRGNLDRMKKLMKRAQAGEKLTIAFLGGSITQGCLTTQHELCYAYRTFQWWEKTFPDAEFTYVNAGIGATDSQLGVARVADDVFAKKPDFVSIEFSVNDEPKEHYKETYEGLVRRVYGDESEPAVMIIHNVYYHNGGNAQIQHSQIARHYKIPSVSMQSSIYPEVVAGRIPNRDITEDDLHPNNLGHELVAGVITHFLAKVLNEIEVPETAAPKLAAPITINAYEHSKRYQNYNYEPKLAGFVKDTAVQTDITDCFKRGWRASREGDSITFEVEGTCIAVQYCKTIHKPAPIAEVVIDGDMEHAVRLDANFDETWGDKLQLDTIAEHIEKKLHTVEIRVVETHEDDKSDFNLISVIGALPVICSYFRKDF